MSDRAQWMLPCAPQAQHRRGDTQGLYARTERRHSRADTLSHSSNGEFLYHSRPHRKTLPNSPRAQVTWPWQP